MSHTIDRDALVQTVASKYGVIITKNDPMLVLLAMHNEIIGNYQDMFLNGLDAFQVNLDELAERQRKMIKAQGETFVTQTLNALRVEHGGIQQRFEDMLAKERQSYLTAVEDKVQVLQKWMWVNLGAALLSVASLLVTVALVAG